MGLFVVAVWFKPFNFLTIQNYFQWTKNMNSYILLMSQFHLVNELSHQILTDTTDFSVNN